MKVPVRKDLGEILVSKGLMSDADVQEAMAEAKKGGVRLGEACIKLGYVDEGHFAEAIAAQYGLDTVNLDDVAVDSEAIGIIPADLLHRAKVVPVLKDGKTVLATADPTDILSLDDIERISLEGGRPVSGVVVAPEKMIEKVLSKGGGAKRMLEEAADGFVDLESLKVSEDPDEVLSIEKIAEDSSPVVKLVDTTIYDALTKHASDIHLESTDKGLMVKYRLDGVLHTIMGPVDKKLQSSVISRVKVMSELDISERRIPQDGRFKIRLKNKAIDFRVSIMPSIHGEDAVIRILDKEHITQEFHELSLSILGFGTAEIEHIRRMVKEPYGMILMTGPTGSGKTTTLYAAISEINTGRDKIITIEDPVEYELAGVVQIPVNEKKGLTFAKGLRSVLRHDPDKIMVGEIRDGETAQIAIQAALTGHLVFTTVHANNVFDVIGRFVHMGIEPYNFVSALNCVLAQRLLRLICPDCKREVEVDDETLTASGLDPAEYSGKTFFAGAGCDNCYQTGYKGRRAILEILDLTDEIRDMISNKEPISNIKKRAIDDGMISLRQVAVGCVLRGETSIEEINRITFVE